MLTEADIEELISQNKELMTILEIIESLGLKDSWLCAGTIRNFIWDYLSGKNHTLVSDIDVVFFDSKITYEETLQLEKQLIDTYPNYDWELKNQFFMNQHNPNTPPYKNTLDAISKFPETCTSICARLKEDQVQVIAPHGIKDLILFNIKPTPFFLEDEQRMSIYKERVTKKEWLKRWPQLTIYYDEN